MGKLLSDNLMLSRFALLAANLVPIIGVLLWGWDVTLIIGLYWIENLVIGLLNLPKMWMCEREGRNPLFLSLFFTVHFGMFCGVHGAAIGTIFMEGDYPLSLLGEPALRLTLIGLFLSHFLNTGYLVQVILPWTRHALSDYVDYKRCLTHIFRPKPSP